MGTSTGQRHRRQMCVLQCVLQRVLQRVLQCVLQLRVYYLVWAHLQDKDNAAKFLTNINIYE